ncbi:GGDEF domain-containing protein GdpS, partial [Staphylococcus sp. E463]
GRYTNMIYTLTSAIIVALVDVLIFDNSIIYGITLIVIAGVVSAVGPFLKQNDIVSLLILNTISIIILFILALFSPIYDLIEIAILIPISFIITIASAITFVDIWHFFSLVNRYENEDKYDYLTGLGNVKEFDRHLNQLSKYTEEHKESLGLLLIDIDGFKDVNDTYTHLAGDAVLKQMSQLLKNYVPKQFSIFRNGGEEFSVVINDYTLDQSVKLAENIRQGVEKSSFHLPNKEVIKLSVSIGVGYLTRDDRKSQRRVFKDADDMVHVAKSEGRNKVMFNPIIKL